MTDQISPDYLKNLGLFEAVFKYLQPKLPAASFAANIAYAR